MSVCVSQEGNINQIRYPDVGHPQLALTDTAFGMSPTTLASRTTAPARASHPRVSAQQLSRRRLAVVPSYVADAVHGRATDRGVVSVMVVDVQPAHKGTDSSAL